MWNINFNGEDMTTRKLFGLAEKISKLEDEEIQMINGYLKILKSTWRIKETDMSQLKKMFKSAKGTLDEL